MAYYTSGDVSIAFQNGLFNYVLTPSANVSWRDITPYIEVTIGGTTLEPRERINTSAYAFYATSAAYAFDANATTLGGYTYDAFVTTGTVQTITGQKTFTQDIIFDDVTDPNPSIKGVDNTGQFRIHGGTDSYYGGTIECYGRDYPDINFRGDLRLIFSGRSDSTGTLKMIYCDGESFFLRFQLRPNGGAVFGLEGSDFDEPGPEAGNIWVKYGVSAGSVSLRGGDLKIAGSGKVHLDQAGTNVSYIDEGWGMQLHGDATHPIQIRDASLVIGNATSADYGTGRIYTSSDTNRYIYDDGSYIRVSTGVYIDGTERSIRTSGFLRASNVLGVFLMAKPSITVDDDSGQWTNSTDPVKVKNSDVGINGAWFDPEGKIQVKMVFRAKVDTDNTGRYMLYRGGTWVGEYDVTSTSWG
ncbi:MAG: hypothetical protein QME68_08505, partial [Elusimicrobiota bacterium]|nr:hypothetical protein [Elusimicrobiota bacterium]